MAASPSVRVHQATVADKTVVAGLLQAYLRDMAPYTGDDPDRSEPYSYPYFDLYWSPEGVAEGRVPYLIVVDDAVAGFAFVSRHSRLGLASTRGIAEFYVEARWRRKGVGRRAVRKLLAMHPGRWEIAVLRANTPARAFWTAVVHEITGGDFEVATPDPEIWDGDIITLELE